MFTASAVQAIGTSAPSKTFGLIVGAACVSMDQRASWPARRSVLSRNALSRFAPPIRKSIGRLSLRALLGPSVQLHAQYVMSNLSQGGTRLLPAQRLAA